MEYRLSTCIHVQDVWVLGKSLGKVCSGFAQRSFGSDGLDWPIVAQSLLHLRIAQNMAETAVIDHPKTYKSGQLPV
jgi:hypothetical protein